MKLTFIADCHLNKTLYKNSNMGDTGDLPFRNLDFMKAFEYMVDKNIAEIHPDLLVIGGDIYDTFDPSNLVRTFFNSQLKKLTEAKIPIVLMVGNHDICRKHHALKPISALGLKNVMVVEQPKLLRFRDKVLMFFPYSLDIERKLVTIREAFHKFVNESHIKIEADPEMKGKEIMFFGHFGVRGAEMNEYTDSYEILADADDPVSSKETVTTKKSFFNNNKNDIGLAELDTIGASYIFLGDYHKHQRLATKNGIAMYSGSIEKTDMSEAEQKKGFLVYDSEAKSSQLGCCSFIEYPTCRPMLELRGTLAQIEFQLSKLTGNYQGAIVKISFTGSADELTAFSIGLDNLKNKLKIKYEPIHIYCKQKVVDEQEASQATAIEEEILERGHLSDRDVMDVVGEVIRESVPEVDEQKILLDIAEDIYKSTMEKK